MENHKNAWTDPNFEPSGDRNLMVGMEETLEELNEIGPVRRTLDDAPPGMPQIKEAAAKIGGLDLTHTQGDRGALRDENDRRVENTKIDERAGEIESEIKSVVGIDKNYVGAQMDGRITDALKKHLLLDEGDQITFAMETSGRKLFDDLHRAHVDLLEDFHPDYMSGLTTFADWPGYAGPMLSGKSGNAYKLQDLVYAAPDPKSGISTAKELERAIEFCATKKVPRSLTIPYIAISTPGNPGLSIPHKELVKIIKLAAEYGIPVWVDNFYGALAPEPTVNMALLRKDLSEEEMGHVVFIEGSTKWHRSDDRLAWSVALGEEGPAVDAVKLAASRTNPRAGNKPVPALSVMLAFLEASEGPFKAIGQVGTEVRRKIELMSQSLVDSGQPFLMSGVSYYAFIKILAIEEAEKALKRPLTVKERFEITNFAFAPGESFMMHPGKEQFARVSASATDSAVNMLKNIS
ncbi:aminotransferase class I/II-fold pyridoxal phosphate-dependent enzyme [Candidatus Peregrinibacteria bacterium]|nr:aminotransferase class I/II-fold pyridoxal phosphate-dependent enzyme [Candidatus Peregrinibacteria bacterium]